VKDKKILVLGSEGMLGREVLKNLIDKNYDIYSTYRGSSYKDSLDQKKFYGINNFDARDFLELSKILDEINPHIIINSIGIIKQLKKKVKDEDFFLLNSFLPKYLEYWCETNKKRLIHFSTDCVFDGKKGSYNENDIPNAKDLYGLSKILGEVISQHSLTIRTSIIGHEINSSNGLLEWFLSQKENTSVNGYKNAFFSGLSTSYLAEVVVEKIIEDKNLHGLLQFGGPRISKFELLKIINKVYKKKININPSIDIEMDKSLNSQRAYKILGIKKLDWKFLVSHLFNSHIKKNEFL
tara:strand:- start:2766 stop:3650 length:885 start_codon:yes stop_codon:yes gene_type:complete